VLTRTIRLLLEAKALLLTSNASNKQLPTKHSPMPRLLAILMEWYVFQLNNIVACGDDFILGGRFGLSCP